MHRFFWLLFLLPAVVINASRAGELVPAFSVDDLDLAACRSFVNGKEQSRPTRKALAAALCGRKGEAVWSTGKHNGLRRHFVVAFKKPLAIGTICAPDYPGTVKLPLQSPNGSFISILKPGVKYSGNPEDHSQWLLLRPGTVKYLPVGTKTRALRFSEIHVRPFWPPGPKASVLGRCVCLRERYYSALDVGSIARQRLDDKTETVIVSWTGPLAIEGLLLHGEIAGRRRIRVLRPGATRPAKAALADDWVTQVEVPVGNRGPFAFTPAVKTRAVRTTAALRHRRSVLKKLVPLVALGKRELSPGARRPPPYKVPYTMPLSGFVAIDVHDQKSGKLVRRLVGETARDQGPVKEPWDLRDEKGQIIPPGKYTWRGLAVPPLKRTYELTLYNAGQPAWRAPPPHGKGGGMWLADHVPPQCAAAQGDIMWLGTGCTENGHCIIATDLEGKKLWGTGHIAEGFRGPSRIAVDKRCAYGLTNTIIYRVDPKREFKGRSIFTINSTSERPWNVGPTEAAPAIGGLAARGGKLYVAINLPNRWLKSSFIADTMDPTNSEPSVRLYKNRGRRRENEKIDKVYGYGRYDELMSFYAAFMTERMPKETMSYPNVAISCNGEAYFGNAPTEGANRGRLVATFRRPVTIGSILIPDGAIKVQVLKPNVPVTKAVGSAKEAMAGNKGLAGDGGGDDPDLDDLLDDLEDDAPKDGGPSDGIWITLKNLGRKGSPTIALAPKGGLKTRAIRYKTKRLAFTQIMARRLGDITAKAQRIFTEGKLTPQGGVWVSRRGRAITSLRPAVMALRWKEEHKIRGLSFMRVGSGEHRPKLPTRIAVDKWIGGNANVKAKLHENRKWQQITVFSPPNDITLFQADFGRTVTATALRIRCLNGSRKDKGVYTSGFHGIVAYEPLGDDPKDLPANMNQRIAVLKLPPVDDDKTEAKVSSDIPLPRPNALAFNAKGVLHCMSDGQIITVPLTKKPQSRVVVTRDKFDQPVQFCFGPKGRIYVSDNGPKVIKVFDPKSGKLVQTIGTPGGTRSGKWDPMRLINPTQVAVDKLGKVWVADLTYTPKRIMVFNPDGTAHKWFLGPTQYGGGGSMDPQDRSIVMYNGMKFRIDWDKRTWKLEALLGHNVERPIYYRGKRYVVGPFPGPSALTKITFERDGVAIPIVVAGSLAEWKVLTKYPALGRKFGSLDPENTTVIWSDKNGDGVPQPIEVQIIPGRPPKDNWDVGEDLSLFAIAVYGGDGICLRPTGFSNKGVPLYDATKQLTVKPYPLRSQTRRAWGDDQGRFFLIGTRLIAADGKTKLWEYPSPWTVHAGFYNTPFRHQRPPGVLSQEHFPIAHFKVGKEEFYVTNSDPGDWYCYTADGMLVGSLFGGPRGYGLKTWPAKWEAGKTQLDDLRLGQEHYQGCVVKANDGKVYAVAGHNHMSIVRIDGLEKLQRISGAITVSARDVEATRQWRLREDMLQKARTEPKVATILRAGFPPAITGTFEEWPNEVFVTIGKTVRPGLNETITYLDGKAALGYDAKNLYLAMQVKDESPMKNIAQDPKTLFKGGDAADLTLGFNLEADPKRKGPTSGDLRLLFALVKRKPVVVLYKPVDPAAPAALHSRFISPVGQTQMDRVQVLTTARMAVKTDRYKQEKDGVMMEGVFWTLEASVPWKALGVAPPKPGTTIRGDFGYLQSDEHGTRTAGRKYWSGKSQTVICDTPSEARLSPFLWGQFVVTKPKKTLRFIRPVGIDTPGLLEPDGDDDDVDVLEMLGE